VFIDIDCIQKRKNKEHTCGDYFISKRYPEISRLIAVLSDGLGSGIKAHILSCMTATMMAKFIEAGKDIRKASEIIMESLPICQIRKISYSTFSAIDCNEDGSVKIVEEGNPSFIWIHNSQIIEPQYITVSSKKFTDRNVHVYNIMLEENDRLIFCSDGITQSGLGTQKFKLGLRRQGLADIVTNVLKIAPNISSRDLSRHIISEALKCEDDLLPKDDMSAMCLFFRNPRQALVFTGPPYHNQRDNFYANIFKDFKGKKAICGGTTANLISRELNIPIENGKILASGNLPPISYMKGVDLVTEGILTLTRAYEYLEQDEPVTNDDPAGRLTDFLLNSDCITFMIGAKINQAHYDPNLPIEIEIRKNIMKKIGHILETRYIKKVIFQYM
jgi:serine/threonine protein phosphatase PrpC